MNRLKNRKICYYSIISIVFISLTFLLYSNIILWFFCYKYNLYNNYARKNLKFTKKPFSYILWIDAFFGKELKYQK